MQSVKLLTFDETDVMLSSIDSHYDADFEYSENLNYAFGVTAYDSNPESIDDPTIGLIKPYYKSWGIIPGGGVHFEPLPTRPCTNAELHIKNETDPDSKFFKPHANSVGDMTFYSKKLKCLDVESIRVQGDYNSPTTRSFVLLFEKCNNATFQGVCKSEEQIKNWLARKFVVINVNQQRFRTREYEYQEKVMKETRFIYIPINSQVREEKVYKVRLTDLRLQDNYYQFSALTEDDRTIFGNREHLTRPYEFPDSNHMQITFEFDLNLYRVDRDVYSILDWIGDIGGLREGLVIILAGIFGLVKFHPFQHFMIEHLYNKNEPKQSTHQEQDKSRDYLNKLQDSKNSFFRQKLNDLLPNVCLRWNFCRLSREERLFAKGRDIWEDEIDVVQLLRKLRRLYALRAQLKSLMPKDYNSSDADQFSISDSSDKESEDKSEQNQVTPVIQSNGETATPNDRSTNNLQSMDESRMSQTALDQHQSEDQQNESLANEIQLNDKQTLSKLQDHKSKDSPPYQDYQKPKIKMSQSEIRSRMRNQIISKFESFEAENNPKMSQVELRNKLANPSENNVTDSQIVIAYPSVQISIESRKSSRDGSEPRLVFDKNN